MSYKAVVVDDDPRVRYVTVRLLEVILRGSEQDFVLDQASDGDSAYELIRESRPDLILMDHCMPGLSGLDLCRKLRDEFGDGIYIVGMSGDHGAGDGFYAAGVDAYLSKPFTIQDVRSAIQR